MTPPTENPTPAEPDRLIADLVGGGALDAERAAGLVDEYHKAHPDDPPSTLSDFLVQKGVLTPVQAERLAAATPELGPYQLLEPVWGGPWGEVFRAISRHDRRDYAVRVLPPPGPWDVHLAVASCAGATHPAVLPLVDAGTAGGTDYLVWAFADGEPLDHSVERVGPFTPADAARLFADLADGLAACHDRGVVHGSVRPAGILIGPDRKPRLADLGLAAAAAANPTAAVPDGTAPEVRSDPTARGPAADAHAFGAALAFALTGVAAETGTAGRHVRSRNPAVPPPLADLIDDLMRESPDDRPADLREVARRLRAATQLPGPPAIAPPPMSTEPWPTPAPPTPSRLRERSRWDDSPECVSFDLPGETPVVTEDWNARDELTPPPIGPPPAAPSEPPRPTVTLPPAFPPPPPPPVIPLRAAGGPDSKRLRDIPSPVDVRSNAGPILSRPPVVVPEPPLFARGPIRSARSLLFWKGASDAVLVSVFGPPAVAPGQRLKVLVYASLPDAFDGVSTLCRALHTEADLLGVGYITRPVPHRAEVRLHMAAAGAGVAKSHAEFTWTGQTQPKSYELFVPWESPAGLTAGMLTADLGGEQAGAIPFHFVIRPRSG